MRLMDDNRYRKDMMKALTRLEQDYKEQMENLMDYVGRNLEYQRGFVKGETNKPVPWYINNAQFLYSLQNAVKEMEELDYNIDWASRMMAELMEADEEEEEAYADDEEERVSEDEYATDTVGQCLRADSIGDSAGKGLDVIIHRIDGCGKDAPALTEHDKDLISQFCLLLKTLNDYEHLNDDEDDE